MVQQGDSFDRRKMSPLAKLYANVTPESKVLLCLSPLIKSSMPDVSPGGKSFDMVDIKAKVIMEGFEINETGLRQFDKV